MLTHIQSCGNVLNQNYWNSIGIKPSMPSNDTHVLGLNFQYPYMEISEPILYDLCYEMTKLSYCDMQVPWAKCHGPRKLYPYLTISWNEYHHTRTLLKSLGTIMYGTTDCKVISRTWMSSGKPAMFEDCLCYFLGRPPMPYKNNNACVVVTICL